MDGGKLIATGSSSCVIRPMIPCKKGKNKINDKRISKLISHKDSKNMMKYIYLYLTSRAGFIVSLHLVFDT